ncbi:MAG: PTS sugar transporter subunit IIA [Planctomycetota bacterium]
MRLNRFLKEENIDLHFAPLDLDAEADPWAEEDDDEDDEELQGRALWETKLRILEPLTHLLDASGRISNRSKLFTDLRNREAKATTGIGRGFAMPHVRTPQAKGFVMGVAIAPDPGLPFDAIDEEPVRLFVPMVAPNHDDKYYLKVERALAQAFADGDELKDALLDAVSAGEVIRILSQAID